MSIFESTEDFTFDQFEDPKKSSETPIDNGSNTGLKPESNPEKISQNDLQKKAFYETKNVNLYNFLDKNISVNPAAAKDTRLMEYVEPTAFELASDEYKRMQAQTQTFSDEVGNAIARIPLEFGASLLGVTGGIADILYPFEDTTDVNFLQSWAENIREYKNEKFEVFTDPNDPNGANWREYLLSQGGDTIGNVLGFALATVATGGTIGLLGKGLASINKLNKAIPYLRFATNNKNLTYLTTALTSFGEGNMMKEEVVDGLYKKAEAKADELNLSGLSRLKFLEDAKIEAHNASSWMVPIYSTAAFGLNLGMVSKLVGNMTNKVPGDIFSSIGKKNMSETVGEGLEKVIKDGVEIVQAKAAKSWLRDTVEEGGKEFIEEAAGAALFSLPEGSAEWDLQNKYKSLLTDSKGILHTLTDYEGNPDDFFGPMFNKLWENKWKILEEGAWGAFGGVTTNITTDLVNAAFPHLDIKGEKSKEYYINEAIKASKAGNKFISHLDETYSSLTSDAPHIDGIYYRWDEAAQKFELATPELNDEGEPMYNPETDTTLYHSFISNALRAFELGVGGSMRSALNQTAINTTDPEVKAKTEYLLKVYTNLEKAYNKSFKEFKMLGDMSGNLRKSWVLDNFNNAELSISFNKLTNVKNNLETELKNKLALQFEDGTHLSNSIDNLFKNAVSVNDYEIETTIPSDVLDKIKNEIKGAVFDNKNITSLKDTYNLTSTTAKLLINEIKRELLTEASEAQADLFSDFSNSKIDKKAEIIRRIKRNEALTTGENILFSLLSYVNTSDTNDENKFNMRKPFEDLFHNELALGYTDITLKATKKRLNEFWNNRKSVTEYNNALLDFQSVASRRPILGQIIKKYRDKFYKEHKEQDEILEKWRGEFTQFVNFFNVKFDKIFEKELKTKKTQEAARRASTYPIEPTMRLDGNMGQELTPAEILSQLATTQTVITDPAVEPDNNTKAWNYFERIQQFEIVNGEYVFLEKPEDFNQEVEEEPTTTERRDVNKPLNPSDITVNEETRTRVISGVHFDRTTSLIKGGISGFNPTQNNAVPEKNAFIEYGNLVDGKMKKGLLKLQELGKLTVKEEELYRKQETIDEFKSVLGSDFSDQEITTLLTWLSSFNSLYIEVSDISKVLNFKVHSDLIIYDETTGNSGEVDLMFTWEELQDDGTKKLKVNITDIKNVGIHQEANEAPALRESTVNTTIVNGIKQLMVYKDIVAKNYTVDGTVIEADNISIGFMIVARPTGIMKDTEINDTTPVYSSIFDTYKLNFDLLNTTQNETVVEIPVYKTNKYPEFTEFTIKKDWVTPQNLKKYKVTSGFKTGTTVVYSNAFTGVSVEHTVGEETINFSTPTGRQGKLNLSDVGLDGLAEIMTVFNSAENLFKDNPFPDNLSSVVISSKFYVNNNPENYGFFDTTESIDVDMLKNVAVFKNLLETDPDTRATLRVFSDNIKHKSFEKNKKIANLLDSIAPVDLEEIFKQIIANLNNVDISENTAIDDIFANAFKPFTDEAENIFKYFRYLDIGIFNGNQLLGSLPIIKITGDSIILTKKDYAKKPNLRNLINLKFEATKKINSGSKDVILELNPIGDDIQFIGKELADTAVVKQLLQKGVFIAKGSSINTSEAFKANKSRIKNLPDIFVQKGISYPLLFVKSFEPGDPSIYPVLLIPRKDGQSKESFIKFVENIFIPLQKSSNYGAIQKLAMELGIEIFGKGVNSSNYTKYLDKILHDVITATFSNIDIQGNQNEGVLLVETTKDNIRSFKSIVDGESVGFTSEDLKNSNWKDTVGNVLKNINPSFKMLGTPGFELSKVGVKFILNNKGEIVYNTNSQYSDIFTDYVSSNFTTKQAIISNRISGKKQPFNILNFSVVTEKESNVVGEVKPIENETTEKNITDSSRNINDEETFDSSERVNLYTNESLTIFHSLEDTIDEQLESIRIIQAKPNTFKLTITNGEEIELTTSELKELTDSIALFYLGNLINSSPAGVLKAYKEDNKKTRLNLFMNIMDSRNATILKAIERQVFSLDNSNDAFIYFKTSLKKLTGLSFEDLQKNMRVGLQGTVNNEAAHIFDKDSDSTPVLQQLDFDAKILLSLLPTWKIITTENFIEKQNSKFGTPLAINPSKMLLSLLTIYKQSKGNNVEERLAYILKMLPKHEIFTIINFLYKGKNYKPIINKIFAQYQIYNYARLKRSSIDKDADYEESMFGDDESGKISTRPSFSHTAASKYTPIFVDYISTNTSYLKEMHVAKANYYSKLLSVQGNTYDKIDKNVKRYIKELDSSGGHAVDIAEIFGINEEAVMAIHKAGLPFHVLDKNFKLIQENKGIRLPKKIHSKFAYKKGKTQFMDKMLPYSIIIDSVSPKYESGSAVFYAGAKSYAFCGMNNSLNELPKVANSPIVPLLVADTEQRLHKAARYNVTDIVDNESLHNDHVSEVDNSNRIAQLFVHGVEKIVARGKGDDLTLSYPEVTSDKKTFIIQQYTSNPALEYKGFLNILNGRVFLNIDGLDINNGHERDGIDDLTGAIHGELLRAVDLIKIYNKLEELEVDYNLTKNPEKLKEFKKIILTLTEGQHFSGIPYTIENNGILKLNLYNTSIINGEEVLVPSGLAFYPTAFTSLLTNDLENGSDGLKFYYVSSEENKKVLKINEAAVELLSTKPRSSEALSLLLKALETYTNNEVQRYKSLFLKLGILDIVDVKNHPFVGRPFFTQKVGKTLLKYATDEAKNDRNIVEKIIAQYVLNTDPFNILKRHKSLFDSTSFTKVKEGKPLFKNGDFYTELTAIVETTNDNITKRNGGIVSPRKPTLLTIDDKDIEFVNSIVIPDSEIDLEVINNKEYIAKLTNEATYFFGFYAQAAEEFRTAFKIELRSNREKAKERVISMETVAKTLSVLAQGTSQRFGDYTSKIHSIMDSRKNGDDNFLRTANHILTQVKDYKKMKSTDGSKYVTLEHYVNLLIQSRKIYNNPLKYEGGQISPKEALMEAFSTIEGYNRIQELLGENFKSLLELFVNLKELGYDTNRKDIYITPDTFLSIWNTEMHKSATNVLLPIMYMGTPMEHFIKAIDKFNSTKENYQEKLHYVNHVSAQKGGNNSLRYVKPFDVKTGEYLNPKLLQDFADEEGVSFSDYMTPMRSMMLGEQMVIKPDLKEEATEATQVQINIWTDFQPNRIHGIYNINTEAETIGEETLFKWFHTSSSNKTKIGAAQLMERFGVKRNHEGVLVIHNLEAFKDFILNEVYNNLASANTKKLLSSKEIATNEKLKILFNKKIITKLEFDFYTSLTGSQTQFEIPLWLTSIYASIVEHTNALVTKNTVRFKNTGESLVLAPDNHIVGDKRNVVTLESFQHTGGMITWIDSSFVDGTKKELADDEVVIPFFFSDDYGRAFRLDDFVEDGKIDMSRIPENLLKIFGFRIPNQGPNSMGVFKVVGFLPSYINSTIIASKNLVVRMGTDYDVDKLFLYKPAYRVSKDEVTGKYSLSRKSYNLSDVITKDIDSVLKNRLLEAFQGKGALKESEKNKLIEEVYEDLMDELENFKLDLLMDKVNHPDWKVLEAQANDYGSLIDDASIIEKAKDKSSAKEKLLAASLASGYNKLSMYNDGLSGKSGIASFANGMGSYLKCQILFYSTGQDLLKFNSDSEAKFIVGNHMIETKFLFKNKNTQEYSYTNIDGELIHRPSKAKAKVIQILQSAAVDNLKDPVLGKLNLNPGTYDVALLMANLGLDEHFIAYFTGQEIVDIFSQKMMEFSGHPYALEDSIDYVKRHYKIETLPDSPYVSFIELYDNIHREQLMSVNVKILSMLNSITNNARGLTRTFTSTKSDKNGVGSTMAELFDNERKFWRIENESKPLFKGVDSSYFYYHEGDRANPYFYTTIAEVAFPLAKALVDRFYNGQAITPSNTSAYRFVLNRLHKELLMEHKSTEAIRKLDNIFNASAISSAHTASIINNIEAYKQKLITNIAHVVKYKNELKNFNHSEFVQKLTNLVNSLTPEETVELSIFLYSNAERGKLDFDDTALKDYFEANIAEDKKAFYEGLDPETIALFEEVAKEKRGRSGSTNRYYINDKIKEIAKLILGNAYEGTHNYIYENNLGFQNLNPVVFFEQALERIDRLVMNEYDTEEMENLTHRMLNKLADKSKKIKPSDTLGFRSLRTPKEIKSPYFNSTDADVNRQITQRILDIKINSKEDLGAVIDVFADHLSLFRDLKIITKKDNASESDKIRELEAKVEEIVKFKDFLGLLPFITNKAGKTFNLGLILRGGYKYEVDGYFTSEHVDFIYQRLLDMKVALDMLVDMTFLQNPSVYSQSSLYKLLPMNELMGFKDIDIHSILNQYSAGEAFTAAEALSKVSATRHYNMEGNSELIIFSGTRLVKVVNTTDVDFKDNEERLFVGDRYIHNISTRTVPQAPLVVIKNDPAVEHTIYLKEGEATNFKTKQTTIFYKKVPLTLSSSKYIANTLVHYPNFSLSAENELDILSKKYSGTTTHDYTKLYGLVGKEGKISSLDVINFLKSIVADTSNMALEDRFLAEFLLRGNTLEEGNLKEGVLKDLTIVDDPKVGGLTYNKEKKEIRLNVKAILRANQVENNARAKKFVREVMHEIVHHYTVHNLDKLSDEETKIFNDLRKQAQNVFNNVKIIKESHRLLSDKLRFALREFGFNDLVDRYKNLLKLDDNFTIEKLLESRYHTYQFINVFKLYFSKNITEGTSDKIVSELDYLYKNFIEAPGTAVLKNGERAYSIKDWLYSMINNEEFITGVATNPAFRDLLNLGKSNLLKRAIAAIVAFVKRVLNMDLRKIYGTADGSLLLNSVASVYELMLKNEAYASKRVLQGRSLENNQIVDNLVYSVNYEETPVNGGVKYILDNNDSFFSYVKQLLPEGSIVGVSNDGDLNKTKNLVTDYSKKTIPYHKYVKFFKDLFRVLDGSPFEVKLNNYTRKLLHKLTKFYDNVLRADVTVIAGAITTTQQGILSTLSMTNPVKVFTVNVVEGRVEIRKLVYSKGILTETISNTVEIAEQVNLATNRVFFTGTLSLLRDSHTNKVISVETRQKIEKEFSLILGTTAKSVLGKRRNLMEIEENLYKTKKGKTVLIKNAAKILRDSFVPPGNIKREVKRKPLETDDEYFIRRLTAYSDYEIRFNNTGFFKKNTNLVKDSIGKILKVPIFYNGRKVHLYVKTIQGPTNMLKDASFVLVKMDNLENTNNVAGGTFNNLSAAYATQKPRFLNFVPSSKTAEEFISGVLTKNPAILKKFLGTRLVLGTEDSKKVETTTLIRVNKDGVVLLRRFPKNGNPLLVVAMQNFKDGITKEGSKIVVHNYNVMKPNGYKKFYNFTGKTSASAKVDLLKSGLEGVIMRTIAEAKGINSDSFSGVSKDVKFEFTLKDFDKAAEEILNITMLNNNTLTDNIFTDSKGTPKSVILGRFLKEVDTHVSGTYYRAKGVFKDSKLKFLNTGHRIAKILNGKYVKVINEEEKEVKNQTDNLAAKDTKTIYLNSAEKIQLENILSKFETISKKDVIDHKIKNNCKFS